MDTPPEDLMTGTDPSQQPLASIKKVVGRGNSASLSADLHEAPCIIENG